MIALAGLLLAALLIAKAAALYSETEKIRAAIVRRKRKSSAVLDMRNRSSAVIAQQMERLAAESAERRAELERLQNEVAKAEIDLQIIQDSPREMLVVFDKASLGREKLWEVRVANPEIAGRGQRNGDGDDPLLAGWLAGRIYLLGGASGAEARDRCAARFPAHLGFRIVDAMPSRLDRPRGPAP